MKVYCIACKKDTENKNPKVFKTKNGRMIWYRKSFKQNTRIKYFVLI